MMIPMPTPDPSKHCPKCKSMMAKIEGTYALPVYLDQSSRDKDGVAINPRSALPIDVYYCEQCRHVDLVAS